MANCIVCGKKAWSDYCMQHKPRKPMTRSTVPLARSSLKPIGPVTRRWIDTRRAWIATHGSEGHHCHYCGILLSENKFLVDDGLARKLTLDHLDARVRRADLRYEFNNLTPACPNCNRKKGSLNHSQFKHHCHTELVTV